MSTARIVKDVEKNGSIRRTNFTDGTNVTEKLMTAVLTDGKVKNTLESSTGTKSYSMNVKALLPDGESWTPEFSALINANLKESEKFEEDPFTEGADIIVAVSKARNKDGEMKKYARIELPAIVTADDIFDDEIFDDEMFADEPKGETAGNISE